MGAIQQSNLTCSNFRFGLKVHHKQIENTRTPRPFPGQVSYLLPLLIKVCVFVDVCLSVCANVCVWMCECVCACACVWERKTVRACVFVFVDVWCAYAASFSSRFLYSRAERLWINNHDFLRVVVPITDLSCSALFSGTKTNFRNSDLSILLILSSSTSRWVWVWVCARASARVRACVCVCVRGCLCVWVYACVCVCVGVWERTCARICIKWRHPLRQSSSRFSQDTFANDPPVYICKHIHLIHTYIYVYICIYI